MSFEQAAAAIKGSATSGIKMTNDELLQIYGLFKQASNGDNNTDKPGLISMPETKAKWDAWTKNKGQSKEAAQAAYVALARTLLQKYGLPVNF